MRHKETAITFATTNIQVLSFQLLFETLETVFWRFKFGVKGSAVRKKSGTHDRKAHHTETKIVAHSSLLTRIHMFVVRSTNSDVPLLPR